VSHRLVCNALGKIGFVLNSIRLIIATAALSFITLYLLSNVKSLGVGVGYTYLGSFAICTFILLIVSGRFLEFIWIRISSLLLLLFLSYFFIKLWLDIGDASIIKQYTIGTTGGVFFGIALGVMVSFIVSDIYLIMFKSRLNSIFGAIFVTAILIMSFFLVLNSFHELYSNVRSDLFLVLNLDGNYQRSGSFLFINLMIDSALLFLVIHFTKVNLKTFVIVNFALYLMISGVSMALSQLIGSNSGFACVAISCVAVVIILVISNKPGLFENRLKIGLVAIFLGWIAKRIFIAISIVSIFLIAGVAVVLHYVSVDANKFRIFGFDSGHFSSVENRIEMLKSNFVEQWSYNPLFGNTQVDVLTTGPGSYAHSLPLSLLTHLGFIGFFLFFGFLIQVYLELTRKRVGSLSMYLDRRFSLFRLFFLGVVIVLATLTTFYSWLPLWFAVGAFGVSLGSKRLEMGLV